MPYCKSILFGDGMSYHSLSFHCTPNTHNQKVDFNKMYTSNLSGIASLHSLTIEGNSNSFLLEAMQGI